MRSYSIIIPVYNRPESLRRLLSSLAKQDPLPLEVLVVEDGSTRRAAEVVAAFEKTLPLHYIEAPHKGPAAARNLGAQHATGSHLVFIDSDTHLPPDYTKHLQVMPASFVFGGGGDSAPPQADAWQQALDQALTAFFTTGGIRSRQGPFERFRPRSHNMIVTREAFLAVSGFASMRYGEDIDLSIRLEQAGYVGVFLPDLMVYHRRKTHPLAFFRQVYHAGYARLALTLKHTRTFRPVHSFPTLFTGGSAFLALLVCFSSVLVLFPLGAYALLVFLDAWVHKKRVQVALLAMLMAFVQLYGYGLGWGWAGLTYLFRGKKGVSLESPV